jgi:hypothetical protein
LGDYDFPHEHNSVPSFDVGTEKTATIREIYKKHAAELLAMEDNQHKFFLLILGS